MKSEKHTSYGKNHQACCRLGFLLLPFLQLLQQPTCAQTLETQQHENNPRIGAFFSFVTNMYEQPFGPSAEAGASWLPLRAIGFPTGINFWLNDQIAFSIEVVPTLTWEERLRVSQFLFHPGIIWNFGKDMSLATRLAFERNGQLGFTPVIGKMIKDFGHSNLSLAVPLPLRFGNDLPSNWSIGLQVGWGF
ncbi:hypothetical protein A3SI_08426 [Nitritalea halalkaliphila LW7]|uniref:Secreted protein n=1 Tax=Nitritalea halalkaliphila LW7 TaxID=1189621 RepID=I5C539_9BACT|nr:hypothetical protein [Nitritalea halalkaliphila]EIM76941.1 hypothetical protein A3SI_08426 [Nitritalea halalkaliphila LW7]